MSKFLVNRGVGASVRAIGVMAFVLWAVTGVAAAATLTAPGISGTLQDGQTLTATPGTPDPSTDTFDTPTYQWSCTPTCGSPTGATLKLTTAEVGATITVTESINDTTTTTPVSATSAATSAVLPLPPANTTLPSIGGIAQQGQTLTANPGGWTPAATGYQYAWTRGSTLLGTGSTYVVQPADIGSPILLTIIASNAGGSSPVASSLPTAAVLPLPPARIPPALAITGTPQQGQVLTLIRGGWANNPTLLTDQWQDCTGTVCTSIPGQTGLTYTVGVGDVGQTIRVVETAFNAAEPPLTTPGIRATSAKTATVTAGSVTSLVVYAPSSPTTNQSVTLIATVSSGASNANEHGAVSFFDGTHGIQGCTNQPVSGGPTVTVVCPASFGAGTANLSATYTSDGTTQVASSASGMTPLTIGKGSTWVTLVVTPQVAPGGRATYVATLGMPTSNTGPVLPSGSIQFLDGGQPIDGCAAQSLTNLTATCSVSYAAVGNHSITVRYGGDGNFTGAGSPASSVQIVQGAPIAPVVHPPLGSTVGWTVHYYPRYSWISALTAYAVAKGTTIAVTCHGKGCPFTTWVIRNASGRVDLTRRFGHRHLRAGTQITVRFTRRGWVGRAYTLTIVAGHKPRVTVACLRPGPRGSVVRCAAA